MRPECVCLHHAFLDLLGPGSTVLDLGAYEGEFSREVSERTGARAVAVEASPAMFEATFTSPRVRKVNLAVGDRQGHVALFVGRDPLGTSVYSDHPAAGDDAVDVPMTTLPALIDDYCDSTVDLLKVNIEGAEIPMFRACDDRTLQGIGQITIQFHDFIPELDMAADVASVKGRLRRLGFGEILFKAPNKDVLFVNLGAGVLGRGRFLAEKALVRYKQYRRALQKKMRRGR